MAVVLVAWVGSQAAAERVEAINGIEKLANSFVQSGKCDDWFAGADPLIARARSTGHCCVCLCVCLLVLLQASGGVNGPLLEALAKAIGYHDPECVELFRTGAPLACRCLFSCSCSLGLHVARTCRLANCRLWAMAEKARCALRISVCMN